MNSVPTPKKRIEIVDVIRGFALFGVLLVNLSIFLDKSGQLDRIIGHLINALAYESFYAIFSVLFGLSFFIFMDKNKDMSFFFKKRLFILLGFGLINALFFWHLDILHAYALTGFILIFLYKMSLRSLKLCMAALFMGSMGIFLFLEPAVYDLWIRYTGTVLAETYRTESYLSNLYKTVTGMPHIFLNTLLYLPYYLFLFLVGLYLGRRGYHKKVKENLSGVRKIQKASFLLAVLLAGFLYLLPYMGSKAAVDFVNSIILEIIPLVLSCFYVSSIIMIYYSRSSSIVWDKLKSIGKMTLTNYLMHSVIFLLLFYNFSLGLYREIPASWGLVLILLIFLFQAELSRWWLERFGQGPLEKFWRNLTYGTSGLKSK